MVAAAFATRLLASAGLVVRQRMCRTISTASNTRRGRPAGINRVLKKLQRSGRQVPQPPVPDQFLSADTDGSSDGNTSDDTSDSSEESDKGRTKSKKSKQKKTSQRKKKETKSKKEKKRSKKSKKQTKQKAAAEKRQRDAEKKERARVHKVKADASKVVAKLASDMLNLEHALSLVAAKSSAVPMPLQKKLKSDYADVKVFYDEASLKMKAKDPLDLTFAPADVVPVVKTATHTKSCIMSMLTTLNQFY